VSHDRLIDAYCEAWCEEQASTRTAQLEAVLTETARYTDPRADTVGAEALSAHIGTILAARPGSRVIRTTAVDEHHHFARFAFRVIGADGTQLLHGVDVAEITAEERIARVIGFIGDLAETRRGNMDTVARCVNG
jgi:hypothetical protein